MKRKIYDKLLDWKNNRQGEVALLIEGARRIGEFVTLPTVLHSSDARTEEGIRYLPLYMTPLL